MKTYEKKALFLDRDGVINEDFGYIFKIEDFKFLDGIFQLLKEFKKREFLIIIITNQSGIQRGYYTTKDFEILTDYMKDEFKKRDIDIDKVYFCPHLSGCECRKPNPGMILAAKDELGIDLSKSYLIGDKLSDIEAGKNAGVKNLFLLNRDENSTNGDFHCIKELKEIINFISKKDEK
mgnify:CR=1 FL=1